MTLREDFDTLGAVVVRGLVGEPHLSRCLAEYHERCAKDIRWNPVEIPVPADGDVADLATHSGIGRVVDELIGEHLVYNVRLVVKNEKRAAPVFLHQDCGYHVGGINKLSAFVALSEVDTGNGAMRFWHGTHRFGYLGDAGELNPEVLQDRDGWFIYTMRPGDVVFMHSSLWHDSKPYVDGPERIMADIIYMPSDDPARLITPEMRASMFKRSRASRLKELQEENARLMKAVEGKS